jgi:hypothetical protein
MDRQNDFKELVGLWMIFVDPPEHTRMRTLMN